LSVVGKLVFGWIVAAMGTVVLSPLLLVLAILVKTTSPGPVFYISDRLGHNGRAFRLIKFRSMRVNSPQILGDDGKVLTIRNDLRVTPIGRFLRLGFDELPQLFNILAGSMTLVGPRPDVLWELDRYTSRERRRLEVYPGLTGLAQVVGGREMNNAQNYELDVRYVENSGLMTDLFILMLTLPYSFGAEKVGKIVLRRFLVGLDNLNT